MCKYPIFRDYLIDIYSEIAPNHDWQAVIDYANDYIQQYRSTVDAKLIMLDQYFKQYIIGDIDYNLEFLEECTRADEPLLRLKAYENLVRYWFGWNFIPRDMEKQQMYLQKVEEEALNIEFESEFEIAMFQNFDATMREFTWNTWDGKLQLIPKLKQKMQAIPIIGSYVVKYYELNLRFVYVYFGDFDEYIKSSRIAAEYFKVGVLHDYAEEYIYEIAISKGDLQAAEQYLINNEQHLKSHRAPMKFGSVLQKKAQVAELRGNVVEALQYWQQLIELPDFDLTYLEDFKARFEQFQFIYRVYNTTQDQQMLADAKAISEELSTIALNNPSERTFKQLADISRAKLLKLGPIKERYEAILILEHLVTNLPEDMELKMLLIELHLEDLKYNKAEETKEYIETLLSEIENHPQRRNPIMLNQYIPFQIILAKYQYYLSGQVDRALNMLYELQELADDNDIVPVSELLKQEIQLLEDQVQQWRHVDLSLIERMKQSNIQNYIQKVQKILAEQEV